MLVQLLQGVGFLLMALARTLPQMLGARVLLGLMGASSTFAFIMAGRRAGGDVRRDVSAIQSGMTLGQVLGPPLGRHLRLAHRLPGILHPRRRAPVGLLRAGGLRRARRRGAGGGGDARGAHLHPRGGTVCLLVLVASTQLFFLTAILPQVLPPLGVEPADTLEVGGLVIFVTGLAAAVGSVIAPRLGELVGDRRAIVWFLGASSLLLAAQAMAPELWTLRGAAIPPGAVHRAHLPALGGGHRPALVRHRHRLRQLVAHRRGVPGAGGRDHAPHRRARLGGLRDARRLRAGGGARASPRFRRPGLLGGGLP